jgi:hypothetical protein
MPHSGHHQAISNAIERSLTCRELRDNVSTVLTLLDHPLHPADLPLKATQPIQHIVVDILRKAHSLSVPLPVSAAHRFTAPLAHRKTPKSGRIRSLSDRILPDFGVLGKMVGEMVGVSGA